MTEYTQTCIIVYACHLCTIAFILTGFATPYWVWEKADDDDFEHVRNMFERCNISNATGYRRECERYPNDELYFAQILYCLSIATTMLAMFTAKMATASAICKIFSGVLIFTAVTIFGVEQGEYTLHWGFGIAATSSALSLAVGIVPLVVSNASCGKGGEDDVVEGTEPPDINSTSAKETPTTPL